MSNKKYIVYLGCSGFPYGMAEVQKMILISKSLVLTGNAVTVISRRGLHKIESHPDLKVIGNYQGIDYVYTSGSPFRSDSFFVRNFLKIKAIVNEYLTLRKMKKNNQLDYAIISTNNYYHVLYYSFLSKVCRFKTILNYVEYYPGQKKKWYKFAKRLNDQLYDRYGPQLCDFNFPISDFLIRNFQKVVPDKKYLKIPVLTDIERYNGIEIKAGQKYILFCGDAAYDEIIKFNINAFERLNDTSIFLYLVIGGSESDKQGVKDFIANSSCKDRIRFLTRLTDKELSTYNKNAIALLIPLRPTQQDEARFPHKIGEYLASGTPVISTNYGEVKHYFKDMEDMLIADSYDINLFADRMQFVVDNPELAEKIGIKGKNIVKNFFDYRAMGIVINEFLNTGLGRQPVQTQIKEQTKLKILLKDLEK